MKVPYEPSIAFPTFLLRTEEDSAPAATPLTLNTDPASSLSLSLVITFPVAFDAPSVIVSVSLLASGAAFTDIFIVYVEELALVPS